MDIMSYEQASNNGLIWKINKEILHPLGLALAYDNKSLTSDGFLIAPDGFFEFSEKSDTKGKERFEKFKGFTKIKQK